MNIMLYKKVLFRFFVVILVIPIVATNTFAQNEKDMVRIDVMLESLVSADDTTESSIKQVQELLDELGFDPGPVDGILGAKTREALRVWKQSSERNVSTIWLVPVAKAKSRSGWSCATEAESDVHRGPSICNRSAGRYLKGGAKGMSYKVGKGGRLNYFYGGAPISTPTGNCSECEIYSQ